jgi:large subunit ribosomal protein L31
MKKEIHPQYHPVVFLDTGAGAEFVTRSTMTSNETRDIDGVKHFVVRMEISSASHPFYTGKRKFVDTAVRVERFRAKYKYQDQDGSPAADSE